MKLEPDRKPIKQMEQTLDDTLEITQQELDRAREAIERFSMTTTNWKLKKDKNVA